jgi:hypothetical protein
MIGHLPNPEQESGEWPMHDNPSPFLGKHSFPYGRVGFHSCPVPTVALFYQYDLTLISDLEKIMDRCVIG